MTSYWRPLVIMALSCVVSEIFNVEKCRNLEIRVKGHQGHWKWYHSIDCVYFLLVFFGNYVPKMHQLWDIRLESMQWPWNPGLEPLKVIEYDTIRSGTHDFLLIFHSNHGPISYRFRDKRWIPSNFANFAHPCVFNAPAEWVIPLVLVWYGTVGFNVPLDTV